MNHLELFAGIGGFRRAMDLLSYDKIMNFKTIGYSEIDSKAIQTYCNIYDTTNEISMGDIVSFTSNQENIIQLPNFDILTGGFPCQTFSMMGKQEGFKEDRGQMFFRIMDILEVKRPRYVLLENVKNLFNHDKGRTYARICKELESLGYHVYSNIFNTAHFHLPQTRNRIFIFATTIKLSRDFEVKYTLENIVKLFEKDYKKLGVNSYETTLDVLAKNVEDKYYLSERIKPTILSNGSAGFKSKSDINQLIARPLTATMHKMHRACQDNYYSQDFIDSAGEINHVENSTKEELAKLKIRKITPEEAFMLQGFPAEFASQARIAGVANGSLYKQAGNAVSVNTIYAILYYLIKNNVITE